MDRINIPLDAITSRLNLQGRFDSVRNTSLSNRFANLKPISEFLDLKRLSKPRDFADVQSRVNYNLSYFSSNYATVFVMLSIYTLLTNLLLTFVILLVVGGMYGIGKLQGRDLDVGFLRASPSQLYTALLVVSVPLGLWAQPFTSVLWLIGATGVSILGHASFMEKDIADSFSGEAGRPPGARRAGGRRRPYPRDYELRDQQLLRRFQEVGSADEDEEDEESASGEEYEDGHEGVLVDPNARDFVSDALNFDGIDLGRLRNRPRRSMYDEDYDSDELELRNRRGGAFQTAVRDKEEALLHSALQRIARARAKGKTNVNLSREEMEALERSTGQQAETSTSRELALVSPSASPAKAAKNKASRSNSSTNLAGQKTRKRGSSGFFGSGAASPSKSNSKAKVSRKPSAEQALPYSAGNMSSGIMVPGPNGVPVYAPISYHNQGPGGAEYYQRPPFDPRSDPKQQQQRRRDSSPVQRTSDPYAYARYYSHSMRPESSSSNRSLPDDIDWHPPGGMASSARTRSPYAAYAPPLQQQHYHPSAEYDPASPPVPPASIQQLSRRHVSGPADVRYTTYNPRRGVPLGGTSGNLARPPAHSSHSDPSLSSRRPVPVPVAAATARSRQVYDDDDDDQGSEDGSGDDDDEDDDEDEGVQVKIISDADNAAGYAVNRVPVAAVNAGGGGGASATTVGTSGAKGSGGVIARRKKGKR